MPSLRIENGTIVTQDAERRVLQGNVHVEDGRIAAVGPDAGADADVDQVIDATGKAVAPGLINLHTHVAMTLFRGYGDDMPLEPWLQERIWPAEAKLTAERTAAGARLGFLEMIAGGTTTFNDMYFFNDAIAEAAEAAGLRGFVGYSFLDFPTPEHQPEEMVGAAREFVKRWQGHDRVTPTLAPHATYTCGPDTLDAVRDLREELGNPLVHTHCSETRTEVYDVEQKHGRRPVEQLDEHGLLTEGTILAHCGWITKAEARRIGASGAAVAHCPVSNMKLATGGYAPLPELFEAGASVGVGTDGPASNNTLNLWESAKMAALVQKHHRWDPEVVPAQQALDMATLHGARALGIADKVGSIEAGKAADVILVDLQRPGVQPVHDVVSQLAYAATAADVTHTIVDGRVLYAGRAFQTLDAAKVVAEAADAAEKVTSAGARE